MPNYEKIRLTCQRNNAISVRLVDENLIYYAADRDGLDGEMDRKLSPYKHITSKFDPSWLRLLKSQYIAHRLFKAGGLIQKYLNHSAIKMLPAEDREYLEFQHRHPWRFSFSMILENPAPNFYEMLDVFTGQRYLLFSPGTTKVLADSHVRLWFNLIAFNGECWQSFGPIAHYQSFEPDDIFFFATELDDSISSDEEAQAHFDRHPVPYMMLLAGSRLPVVVHQEDEVVLCYSWHEEIGPQLVVPLNEYFGSMTGVDQVTKFELEGWAEFPHFACVYYDADKELLMLSAMTDRGYGALVEKLDALGIAVPDEADVRVHTTMLTVAQDILKRKIQLNEYEALFSTEEDSPASREPIQKLNELIGMALPDINAGRQPDIKKLANQVGLDEAFAREALSGIMEKLGDMRGKS